VQAFERVAHAAASRAGALIRARYAEPSAVQFKSEVDLVTETDREAERLIVAEIVAAFPDHGIVAEESPPLAAASPYRWFVDPLDGTTNFAHGFPHFAVSIALEFEGRLVLGLVLDPVRGERFSALHGQGARLNGAPIGVSGTSDISTALLGTGFAPDRRHRAGHYLAFVEEALQRAHCIRRAGSAALDLCYVACGRLDGYWEWQLGPWDTAAGRLIVEEAGGRVTDAEGRNHRVEGPSTVASNGRLHPALLEMIVAGRRRPAAERP
jgi:myo-inositol-1(or 4)-monophosphatase